MKRQEAPYALDTHAESRHVTPSLSSKNSINVAHFAETMHRTRKSIILPKSKEIYFDGDITINFIMYSIFHWEKYTNILYVCTYLLMYVRIYRSSFSTNWNMAYMVYHLIILKEPLDAKRLLTPISRYLEFFLITSVIFSFSLLFSSSLILTTLVTLSSFL